MTVRCGVLPITFISNCQFYIKTETVVIDKKTTLYVSDFSCFVFLFFYFIFFLCLVLSVGLLTAHSIKQGKE